MKTLLKIVAVLGILGAIGLFLMITISGKVMKTVVESAGSEIIQAPITIDDISVSFFSKEFEINGLTIGNPEGFNTSSAFKINQFKVKLGEVGSENLILDEVIIDGTEVTYEKSLTGSNIDQIIKNIEAFVGDAEEEIEEDSEDSEEVNINVEVTKFEFTNAKIKLSAKLLQGKVLSIPLPGIHLTDIGKKNDVTIADFCKTIFQSINKSIQAAILNPENAIKSGAKLLGNSVKLLDDGAGKTVEGAQKAVKNVLGIFKK